MRGPLSLLESWANRDRRNMAFVMWAIAAFMVATVVFAVIGINWITAPPGNGNSLVSTETARTLN